MKALMWDGASLELGERAAPSAGPGEALVAVEVAGVCNTDLEIARGYMGFRGILGHEFVGRVAEGPPEWLGVRVVCEINFACDQCPTCDRGLGRHCPERRVLGIQGADGAFAEFVAVPLKNLHRVPDTVSSEAAVFCEPLAAAFEILEQIEVRPELTCRVFGDGKLGLLVAQVLHSTGAQVEVVGHHEKNLAMLRGLGVKTSRELERAAKPVDLSVEATGSPAGLASAIGSTRPRGTLVLKSTIASTHEVDLAPLVIHEISLVGSRCGPFTPALQALEKSRIRVDPLISDRFPLDRAPDAMRKADEGGVLKVLIDCTAG